MLPLYIFYCVRKSQSNCMQNLLLEINFYLNPMAQNLKCRYLWIEKYIAFFQTVYFQMLLYFIIFSAYRNSYFTCILGKMIYPLYFKCLLCMYLQRLVKKWLYKREINAKNLCETTCCGRSIAWNNFKIRIVKKVTTAAMGDTISQRETGLQANQSPDISICCIIFPAFLVKKHLFIPWINHCQVINGAFLLSGFNL